MCIRDAYCIFFKQIRNTESGTNSKDRIQAIKTMAANCDAGGLSDGLPVACFISSDNSYYVNV